jgi:hypothetical protein
MGLTINQEKIKFVEVSSHKTKEKHIIIDNKKIEKMNFNTLGPQSPVTTIMMWKLITK